MMRRLLATIMIMNLALAAFAVRAKVHRMSDGSVLYFTRSPHAVNRLPTPFRKWDPKKVYRIPVILMSFADCDFAEDHQLEFYQNLFNTKGFNLRHGVGCVADYFRDQSFGQFNVKFDVVGPIKLTTNQKSTNKQNFGDSQFKDAINKADDQLNYADYDWDGDGKAETVIIVFAGYGGNDLGDAATGCIWPNTDDLYMTLDNVRIGGYSSSSELWTNNGACGIGTICHEFMHVLGLPDLYPTSGKEFSVLDEWDLMDGGNYADDGWCPPNLSIQEREYLGWQSPIDLTATITVTEMPPYDDGGVAYRIVNDAYPDEYYLLENRQWKGWDMMLPGHGLLITHVDFSKSIWENNMVNSDSRHHRMEYFHADSLDFNYFDDLYDGAIPHGPDGRNLRLQTTAYPYVDAEGISHDALTDETKPAASLFNKNADGMTLMGKPIKEIRETDGLISFKFYESNAAGISPLSVNACPVAYYDLQGRRITEPSSGLYIIRYDDGTTKKMIR